MRVTALLVLALAASAMLAAPPAGAHVVVARITFDDNHCGPNEEIALPTGDLAHEHALVACLIVGP